MTDVAARANERTSASNPGDKESSLRERHDRCRRGEHCACVDLTVKVHRPGPGAATHVFVQLVDEDENPLATTQCIIPAGGQLGEIRVFQNSGGNLDIGEQSVSSDVWTRMERPGG